MAPGEKSLTAIQRFAAEQIAFDLEGSSDEIITRLLRKLRDDDYLPDPLAHDAVLTLADRPLPLGTRAILHQKRFHDHDSRLYTEVERFASEFFAIPVEQRVDRWKKLVEQCSAGGPLLDRLADLKPGLKVDVSRVDDPSPVVKRLIDDLLGQFPLPPAARAAEVRAKIERFVADPRWTAIERSKAVKDLKRRHAAIAGLSNDFVERIATKPKKPTRLKPVKTPAAGGYFLNENKTAKGSVLVAIMVVGALSQIMRSYDRVTRPATPFIVNPNPLPPQFPNVTQFPTRKMMPPLKTPASPGPARAPNLIVRDELKVKIRGELERLDKPLPEPELDRIIAGLPFEIVPNIGGMATIRLLGAWTETMQTRFVAALKGGLIETDLDLTEAEIDALVANCLPRRAVEPATLRSKSP